MIPEPLPISAESFFNPLECKGNYSACNVKYYEVGRLQLAVDEWAVIFGTAMRGLGGLRTAPLSPLIAVLNVTAHPSTASVIRCSAVLMCPCP